MENLTSYVQSWQVENYQFPLIVSLKALTISSAFHIFSHGMAINIYLKKGPQLEEIQKLLAFL